MRDTARHLRLELCHTLERHIPLFRQIIEHMAGRQFGVPTPRDEAWRRRKRRLDDNMDRPAAVVGDGADIAEAEPSVRPAPLKVPFGSAA